MRPRPSPRATSSASPCPTGSASTTEAPPWVLGFAVRRAPPPAARGDRARCLALGASARGRPLCPCASDAVARSCRGRIGPRSCYDWGSCVGPAPVQAQKRLGRATAVVLRRSSTPQTARFSERTALRTGISHAAPKAPGSLQRRQSIGHHRR